MKDCMLMMQYVVDLLEEFSDYFGTILKYIGLCVLCMLMMQHGGNILDEFSSSVMAAGDSCHNRVHASQASQV